MRNETGSRSKNHSFKESLIMERKPNCVRKVSTLTPMLGAEPFSSPDCLSGFKGHTKSPKSASPLLFLRFNENCDFLATYKKNSHANALPSLRFLP